MCGGFDHGDKPINDSSFILLHICFNHKEEEKKINVRPHTQMKLNKFYTGPNKKTECFPFEYNE